MASAVTVVPGRELVVNGGFDNGTSGWRTNSTDQQLSAVSGGHAGAAARLVAAKAGNVVLNDVAPTVSKTTKGEKYSVSAWVKADSAPVSGQLRVREVAGINAITHGSSFYVDSSGWQQVQLDFSASTAGASLDLNVIGWNLAAQAGLLVDDVSLKAQSSGASTPAPAPAPSGTSSNPGASQRGIPANAPLVGAAVGSNTDPSSFEKSLGAKLQIRRTYWGGGSVTSAVNTARTDIAAGRIPWESFKLPYSWSDMAAGKGDAWVKDLATRLGSLNGPVWIAFHHEPEGDGDISQWVAMQKHLAPIIHSNTKNVAYTMIMTGWHELYGGPQYALDKMWPGDGVVDMIGFDIYNNYGVTKNGSLNTKTTDFGTSYYPQFSAFAKKHHVAWGVAETGLTDQAASADPNWLNRSYTDMMKYGGSALSYFNTSLHSVGSWQISTTYKQNQFRDVLKNAIS